MASEQTGWVIETARHSYWTGRALDDFSDDISWAVRFARFEDGEMVRCRLMSPHLSMLVRVTEHIWTLPPVRAEEPTDRQRAKCCACGDTEAGYMAEELDGVYCKHCWDDLRNFFQREAAALPPVQEPPKRCRMCGDSGWVAEKRFIDDGYGEVDSCPACCDRDTSSTSQEPPTALQEAATLALSALETGATYTQRKLAWNALRDAVWPSSSPSQGVRLDDLKALQAILDEMKACANELAYDEGKSEVQHWYLRLRVSVTALSAALEGATTKGQETI